MSLVTEWEKILVEQEKTLDDKIRRRIRLNSEVEQKKAEMQLIDDDIKNCEVIIKRIRKEQWKEEDKAMNKLRTSGVVRESKGTKKAYSKR